MKPFFSIIVFALIFAGCATTPPIVDAPGTASNSLISQDPYSKLWVISAPKAPVDYSSFWQLRAYSMSPDGPIQYQLHSQFTGSTWIFPSGAWDNNGNAYKVERGATDVGYGGIVTEVFTVDLPRDYLDRAAIDGIDIRVDGRRSLICRLKPWYVAGFLRKVDEFRTGQTASR